MTKRQIRAYLQKNYGLATKIADKCGVGRSMLSMWLRDVRTSPKLDKCVSRVIREHQNAAH